MSFTILLSDSEFFVVVWNLEVIKGKYTCFGIVQKNILHGQKGTGRWQSIMLGLPGIEVMRCESL